MCRNPDRCPTHPGELLREDMIPATKKSNAEIARVLGISRQHLHDILTERKSVSPDVAGTWPSCSGTCHCFGSGCRGLMMPGMPPARSMSRKLPR